jgi:hypothetical protein
LRHAAQAKLGCLDQTLNERAKVVACALEGVGRARDTATIVHDRLATMGIEEQAFRQTRRYLGLGTQLARQLGDGLEFRLGRIDERRRDSVLGDIESPISTTRSTRTKFHEMCSSVALI